MVSTNPQTSSEAVVVKKLYEAFIAGDTASVAAFLADDVVFRVPGTGQNAGDYHGKEAVFGFFAKAGAITGGTLRLELRDVLVGQDFVAAVATYTATRPDKAPLENNLVHLMRVRDGKVCESWYHSRNQYEVDAFWT